MWCRARLIDLARAGVAGLEGTDVVPAAVGRRDRLVAASTKVDDEAARQCPSLQQGSQKPTSSFRRMPRAEVSLILTEITTLLV